MRLITCGCCRRSLSLMSCKVSSNRSGSKRRSLERAIKMKVDISSGCVTPAFIKYLARGNSEWPYNQLFLIHIPSDVVALSNKNDLPPYKQSWESVDSKGFNKTLHLWEGGKEGSKQIWPGVWVGGTLYPHPNQRMLISSCRQGHRMLSMGTRTVERT